jgi:hypothetical protein
MKYTAWRVLYAAAIAANPDHAKTMRAGAV